VTDHTPKEGRATAITDAEMRKLIAQGDREVMIPASRIMATFQAIQNEEIERLRALYQDEHDWATSMFEVVEAARAMITVCQYPCGDPGKCGNCNALCNALARYDGSYVVPA
jgi:hypothetical protein